MSRELTLKDLKNIVYASVLFGGGGGGSSIEGLELIEAMKKDGFTEHSMVSLEEMEAEENGKPVVSTMVAALGSPTATKGQTFIDESKNAIVAMKEAAESKGTVLKYIYSGEQGGGNTALPIYTAWKMGMPLLDIYGNGRAVPEMNTGLQPIYDVPTSPVTFGSGGGDTIIAKTENPLDSAACENIARHLCQAYGQGIGFSAWMMDKEQHRNSSIGMISLDIEVGNALAESTEENVLEKLEAALANAGRKLTVFTTGTISNIEMDAEGGFDTGFTTIESDTNETYKVLFQNENLVCYKIGKDGKKETLATVPGIISLINMRPETEAYPVPVSNCETEIGQKVALVHVDAPEGWYRVPEGFECWKEVLADAGYTDGEVRP